MKWFIWTTVMAMIAGCVTVVVQMGEKNVAHREADVGLNSADKDKERQP